MENIFDILRDGLAAEGINPRSDKSRRWLREKIDAMGNNSLDRNSLMRNEPLKPTVTPLPGSMYMFNYDPENKKKLPYYDRFPLVVLVELSQDGFGGLNLHYLPIDLRQKLFYGLLERVSNKSYNKSTYMRLTYSYLKSTRKVKGYRPCYKRYLTNNVKGQIVNVPPKEWEYAVHLPTAMFSKASQSKVHMDSRRMVQRF